MPRQPTVPLLSIVIPAFDELPNLRELLPRIAAVTEQISEAVEVLVVVRAAPSDAEVAFIQQCGGRAIRRNPTDCFGDAIRSGIAALSDQSTLTVFMDADGSHAPETLPRLLAAARNGHVVIASRYAAGGSSENTMLLRAMSRALNLVYALVLGINCRDISTNFKLYQSKDLREVTLSCRDFDVVEELLFAVRSIHRKDFQVVEVPDRFHNRVHGVTKRRLGPFILSYIRTLLRLRLRSRRAL